MKTIEKNTLTETQENKIRDEWRNLNLQISQQEKRLQMNLTAGIIPSDEYINWLNELKQYRDSLTKKLN